MTGAQGDGTDYWFGFNSAGTFDLWPLAQAIRPASSK